MSRYFRNEMRDFRPSERVETDVGHWKEVAVIMSRRVNKKMPPTFNDCDGGLYVGCAGAAYMFYYMSQAEGFSDMKGELLTKARNYMDVALSYAESRCRDQSEQVAFLLGRGGVYAVGALIYQALGESNKATELNKKYLSLASACQNVNFLACGSDELFVGRAGYLCGAQLLNRQFGQFYHAQLTTEVKGMNFVSVFCDGATDAAIKEQGIMFLRLVHEGVITVRFLAITHTPRPTAQSIYDEVVQALRDTEMPDKNWKHKLVGFAADGAAVMQVISEEARARVCKSIIHSGRIYAKTANSPCPLMYAYYGTEYLGAAHGVSAILQMLLGEASFLRSEPAVEAEVHQCVDYILSLMQPSGNFAPDLSEALSSARRDDTCELVHWCHGGPGMVYMLAKAFLLWRDDKYLDACLRCGELTWQKGLLRKGPGICHGVAGSGYVFLLLYRLTSDEKHLYRAIKFAEYLTSDAFEQAARVPDSPYSLYEGIAGTVCFLTDLIQPLKAEFPFFDVFSN